MIVKVCPSHAPLISAGSKLLIYACLSDWELSDKTISLSTVEASLKSFYSKPKSPGLIILEHELYPQTVQVFMEHYPQMLSTGWEVVSQAQMFDDDWFQNGTAQAPNVTNGAFSVSSATPTSSSSTTSDASTTAASQGGGATGGAAQGNGSVALRASGGLASVLAFVLAVAFSSV